MLNRSESDLSRLTPRELRNGLHKWKKQLEYLRRAFPRLKKSQPLLTDQYSSGSEGAYSEAFWQVERFQTELIRRGEYSSAPSQGAWHRSPENVINRRRIVLKNSTLSARKLCQLFDNERVALPDRWEEELRVTSWVGAIESGRKGRNRVDNIIYKDKKAK